jgi:hypothetical protein
MRPSWPEIPKEETDLSVSAGPERNLIRVNYGAERPNSPFPSSELDDAHVLL